MNYPQQGYAQPPQYAQPQQQAPQPYGAPPAAQTPPGYAPPGYPDPNQPPAAANPWATPPGQAPQAAPPPAYGAPPAGYQQQPQQPAPPPGYGALPPNYAQPAPPAPPQGYGAPGAYGQPPAGYAAPPPPQGHPGHVNPYAPTPQSQGYASPGAAIAGADEGRTRYGALPHGGGTATHDITILRSAKPERTEALVLEMRVDASSCVMPGAVHSIFQYYPLANDQSDKAKKQRSDFLRLVYRLNGFKDRADADSKGFTAQHVAACVDALLGTDPGPFAGRRYRVQVTKSKKPGKNGEHYPNAEFMDQLPPLA